MNKLITWLNSREWRKTAVAGMLLCTVLIAFHFVFIQQLIPPQQGWWQYYGWQLNEGKILYKDLFCFLPPYYIWFQAFLYPFFGMNMFSYLLLGMIISCLTAVLLLVFLRQFTSLSMSFVAVLGGAILQFSYLMYIPLDYNQLLGTFVICASMLFAVGWRNGKLPYFFVAGLVSGCLVMSKQTGIAYIGETLFILSILGIFDKSHQSREKAKKGTAFYIFGCAVAILPGFLYLLYTGTFNPFLFDIFHATSSKGTLSDIIYRNYKIGFSYTEVAIACLSLGYLGMYRWRRGLFLRKIANFSWFKCAYIYVLYLLAIHKVCRATGGGMELFFVMNLVYWFVWIINQISPAFFTKQYACYGNGLKKCLVIGISMVGLIICTDELGFLEREHIYNIWHLFTLKRAIVEMAFWIPFIYCLYEFIQLIRKREIDQPVELALFLALEVGFVFIGLISSVIEEHYIMPLFAGALVLISNKLGSYDNSRFQALAILSLLFIIPVSVTQKQIVPYSWHAWNTVGNNIPGIKYNTFCTKELSGFYSDAPTARAYDDIVTLVKKYSAPDEAVFYYPHIPLFNLLAYRGNGMNTVSYYFDVCPDDIASEAAEYLELHPPKMVIWDKFGKANWDFHEHYFRGGGEVDSVTFWIGIWILCTKIIIAFTSIKNLVSGCRKKLLNNLSLSFSILKYSIMDFKFPKQGYLCLGFLRA